MLINSMLTGGQIVLRADTEAFMGFLKGEFHKQNLATLGKFPQFLHKWSAVFTLLKGVKPHSICHVKSTHFYRRISFFFQSKLTNFPFHSILWSLENPGLFRNEEQCIYCPGYSDWHWSTLRGNMGAWAHTWTRGCSWFAASTRQLLTTQLSRAGSTEHLKRKPQSAVATQKQTGC